MTSLEERFEMSGGPPSQGVAEACRYLESWGMRFLVDFGTHNAVEKAWPLFTLEIAGE